MMTPHVTSAALLFIYVDTGYHELAYERDQRSGKACNREVILASHNDCKSQKPRTSVHDANPGIFTTAIIGGVDVLTECTYTATPTSRAAGHERGAVTLHAVGERREDVSPGAFTGKRRQDVSPASARPPSQEIAGSNNQR